MAFLRKQSTIENWKLLTQLLPAHCFWFLSDSSHNTVYNYSGMIFTGVKSKCFPPPLPKYNDNPVGIKSFIEICRPTVYIGKTTFQESTVNCLLFLINNFQISISEWIVVVRPLWGIAKCGSNLINIVRIDFGKIVFKNFLTPKF